MIYTTKTLYTYTPDNLSSWIFELSSGYLWKWNFECSSYPDFEI